LEERESDGAKTIGGCRFFNQTTTNQKMEFVVQDYWGGHVMAVDGVRGGILACLGIKNTICCVLRWPPNDDKHNNQPNVCWHNKGGKRYNE
jgi:hypothetical protein